MEDRMAVCGKTYRIIRLLGHGKGGYSYLAEREGRQVVLKQIHHEPCDYYQFGDKIEAERRDYTRLREAGIRIPELIDIDPSEERIVKEYIEGPTVFDLVREGAGAEAYLDQVQEMAARAKDAGLNIDYFPTNFIVRDGIIWYVDYECNEYMEEWSFENWGIRYWSRTPEFEDYLTKERIKEMNKRDIIIRNETESDYRAVENLVRESFWNVYRPGCYEHFVLHRLRSDPAFVPELDFVMEKDGELIGQNMFMRAVIKADDGRDVPIMTMGPICIAPEYKRQGYGKILLDYSLEKAAEAGCGALCFEGNIDFYGKSGFVCASKYGIRYHDLPEDADASFFLCRELIPGYLNGVTGVYGPPEGYYAAEQEPEAFERFDAQFPPKEKLKLPGQLFS